MTGWELGLWKNVSLSDKTRVRLNSDGVGRLFGKNGVRFSPKNTLTKHRPKVHDASGANKSDGRTMLVKNPATLNISVYFEVLNQYNRHLNFPDLVFQQNNVPVHKKSCVSSLSGPNAMRGAYSPDLNPIEIIWDIFQKAF